jgi:hypothetical protein
MRTETPGVASEPSTERDGELAQLRATVWAQTTSLADIQAGMARQQALIEALLAERGERPASTPPEPRPGKRAKRTAEAARAPRSESPPTSRRGLLKRLGTSAAGAAVAATALGATRPEQVAADALATLAGPSTADYGVYASPNGVTRPTLAVGQYGLIGIDSSSATVSPLNFLNAGVYGGANFQSGVIGGSNTYHGVLGQSGVNPSAYPGAAGVTGVSMAQIGTQGQSANSHGVFGRTSAAAGTVKDGLLAAGVTGRTSGTIALYGYSDGQPNPN